MVSSDWLLALDSAAGLCEVSGIAITIIDLRSKAATASRLEHPEPGRDFKESIVRQAAAARGGATYGQVEDVTSGLIASLRSGWLLFAAALLIIGAILGTVGAALGA